jgi:hypothetical protein
VDFRTTYVNACGLNAPSVERRGVHGPSELDLLALGCLAERGGLNRVAVHCFCVLVE